MNIGERPAFPRPASEYTAGGTLPDGNDAIQGQDGMTYRQWLAGVIMQGMAAGPYWAENFQAVAPYELGAAAHAAVTAADALITRLNEPHASLDA